MWVETTSWKLVWIAHEPISYAHGRRHIHPIELVHVNKSEAPVNDLSTVLSSDSLSVSDRVIIGDIINEVASREIITAGIGNILLDHGVENIDCLLSCTGNNIMVAMSWCT